MEILGFVHLNSIHPLSHTDLCPFEATFGVRGGCDGASGIATSEKSSCATALIVNASGLLSVLDRVLVL